MKKISKKLCFILLFLFLILAITLPINAETKTTYINLEKMEYTKDNNENQSIKKYSELEEFLEDYNTNNLDDVYITQFLFDGIGKVKTPDLDDFIDANSNDAKIKDLDIQVLNINNIGNYELTGKTVGTMIAVNTNDLKGSLDIYLNNVELDTDSKKAPAIYIYNKDINYTNCNVTIRTLKNSSNILEGGKLKKVSLLDKDNLNNYSTNYSNDALDNYNNFTSYYGIYSQDEINNILFATVKADNEDLSDGDPLYFYKASGAISSDIDLTFEGEGYLKVTSKNKEGIETKGNLSLVGGKGDYEVLAQDDCLNTTTARSAGANIRNEMTIDVGSLIAIVSDEGDEGDAIDSNGSLIINGGNIYAFSNSNSQDAGLDSENGIIINGGNIIATGNMSDRISNESKQKFIYLNFNNKITQGTLIAIKDEKDNIITAFETNKDIRNLVYSSSDLNYESLKVYTNGNIKGDSQNGLYTKISSYENGEEISYQDVSVSFNQKNTTNNISSTLGIALTIEFILLLIVLLIAKLTSKNKE